jgi:hypothetical protein
MAVAYSDKWLDTPENRKKFQEDADTVADFQGVNCIVIKHKDTGQIGMTRKSMFDPETETIIYEAQGKGVQQADEDWDARMRELEDGEHE